MLPNWLVVGFTGHRDLADPKIAAAALTLALDRLSASHQPLIAISSVASGADTLFLEEVARRKLPYFVTIPFCLERFRRDFSVEDWNRASACITGALNVDEVQQVCSDEEAYFDAGIRSVDRADVVIAVWNEDRAAGVGGTGDVVGYSRAREKPLLLINPTTGEIVTERIEKLKDSVPSPDPLTVDPYSAVVNEFKELDTRSERTAPKSRNLILKIICLHLIAAAVAICAGTLHAHGWLNDVCALSKILILLVALALAYQHRKSHHAWVESRPAAEVCRSFLAIWKMHRRSISPSRFSLPGLDRLNRRLCIAWYLDASRASSLDAARNDYLQNRVIGQIKYFDQKYRTSRQHVAVIKIIANTITAIAILLGIIALVLSNFTEEGWPFFTIKLVSGLLPLIPPALLSLLVAHDLARRASRYSELVMMLREAARQLDNTPTWQRLSRVVNDTELALLREVFEWQAVTQFAGHSH